MNSITALAKEGVVKCCEEIYPRYILLVDATPDEEKKLLTTHKFPPYQGEFHYLKVADGIFYSYSTHTQPGQSRFLFNVFGHLNFVVAEVFDKVLSNHRWTDQEGVKFWKGFGGVE